MVQLLLTLRDIHDFEGSLEEARMAYSLGVAVGKLGIATSDTRPPRLVVDFTVSGTNPNCDIPEHQQLPSAKDVVRTFLSFARTFRRVGSLGTGREIGS